MKKLILLSLILFLGANYETVSYGVIKGDNVRIRADKSLSSKVIGALNKFDTVTIIGDSGKEFEIDGESFLWYNISYKEKTGWIYGKYVNILPTEPRENKYYIKMFEDQLKITLIKDSEYHYSCIIGENETFFKAIYDLDLSQPGYLYFKSRYSDDNMRRAKEVYQYDNDKLKLIIMKTDLIKVYKNYIISIDNDENYNTDRIYSIKVFDMNKPIKDNEFGIDNCIFEKVFEMEENTEEGIRLQFDYETLTLSVYMEKLKQTVSVLKFKNGVFQP